MSEPICPRCGMPVLPHDPQEIHGVNHYHQPYACCELLVAKLGHVNQRVSRAIAHTHDIIGKRVDLEQTRAELRGLLRILEDGT